MELVDSVHPDVSFIAPFNTENSFEGEKTDVVYHKGHKYTVIDGAVAVKEHSHISKVVDESLGYFIATICIASAVAVWPNVIASAVLGGVSLISAEVQFLLNLQVNMGVIPPFLMSASQIQKLRQDVNKRGMVDYLAGLKSLYVEGRTPFAFSKYEVSKALEKDIVKYTKDQLIEKLGWFTLLNYLSKETVESLVLAS